MFGFKAGSIITPETNMNPVENERGENNMKWIIGLTTVEAMATSHKGDTKPRMVFALEDKVCVKPVKKVELRVNPGTGEKLNRQAYAC